VTCGSARFAEAIDTQQPTVSQQLRVLRQLGLLISKRRGRLIFHSLYDGHVSALLEEAAYLPLRTRAPWCDGIQ
jgi:DNA-binding transcriptional ArsR family regulator